MPAFSWFIGSFIFSHSDESIAFKWIKQTPKIILTDFYYLKQIEFSMSHFSFSFSFNIKIWRRVKQLIERASFHMFPFNYFFLARPHRPGFPYFPLCWFAFYYFVSFHGSRCLIRPMHKERNQKNFLARNTNKSWATGEPQSTANKQKKTKRINVCVCVWAVLEFIVSFTIHGSRKSVCGASVIMDERGCVTEKFVTQIFVDCGLLFFLRIRFERVKHEWTFLFPFIFMYSNPIEISCRHRSVWEKNKNFKCLKAFFVFLLHVLVAQKSKFFKKILFFIYFLFCRDTHTKKVVFE